MCDDEIKPFKGQVYEDLKSQHSPSNLFEDPLFPAVARSLFTTQKGPQGIRWKRPKEVRRNAKFVVNGFDRCDMDQGAIGNCWFIAGCVGIMQSPACFAKVVPQDQGFDSDYAGIFHFRFWLYGEWVDVVIDDRLPFFADGKLVFANNKEQPDEFWAALLEKAYAKLYGNYENLEAGQTTDALIDMSGGIEESFDLKKLDDPTSLWTALFQGAAMNSIMGCSILPDPGVKEARMSNGLVRGHAYTVTTVKYVNVRGWDIQLLRIRNPWGNDVEWKGAWSDKSAEWNSVSADVKEEVGFSKGGDGEFWMSFSDFLKNWDSVQICHLSADSFSGAIAESNDLDSFSWNKISSTPNAWHCRMFQSEWNRSTAGGCGAGNAAKFWTNPQFLVDVADVDKYDDDDMCSIIVALMQKDSRLKRKGGESSEEFVQFRLFRIKEDVDIDRSKSTGMRFYSNQLDRCGTSGSYINSREITKRFRVKPGSYVIIPSTYDPDIHCEFILRVFTEQIVETSNLDQHKDEELNEDEAFFELEATDHLFNSWGNLLGGCED